MSKLEEGAIRDVVRNRAGGRCQCDAEECAHHEGRCRLQLGSRWGVHMKNPEGSFNMLNLQAFCVRCQGNAKRRASAT